MPLYFAYGSNMDQVAMRLRCPRSRALGRASLKAYRFYLMGRTGYASVRHDKSSDVHGVLFDLAPSDVAALDLYEDIADGLYTKETLPVLRDDSRPFEALIYLGADLTEGGVPLPGYMESIVAAAEVAMLPAAHIADLRRFIPGESRMPRPSVGPTR